MKRLSVLALSVLMASTSVMAEPEWTIGAGMTFSFDRLSKVNPQPRWTSSFNLTRNYRDLGIAQPVMAFELADSGMRTVSLGYTPLFRQISVVQADGGTEIQTQSAGLSAKTILWSVAGVVAVGAALSSGGSSESEPQRRSFNAEEDATNEPQVTANPPSTDNPNETSCGNVGGGNVNSGQTEIVVADCE